MSFTKVKHAKGETELAWKEINETLGETIEHKLTSFDKPRPELFEALQCFIPYVVEICELPEGYAEGMRIQSLSLSDTELGTGIVVTALKKLSGANSPLVLNTPFISEKASSDKTPSLPRYVFDLIMAVDREASLYRKGVRAQQELPLGASA